MQGCCDRRGPGGKSGSGDRAIRGDPRLNSGHDWS
jgi:hypothetical protein